MRKVCLFVFNPISGENGLYEEELEEMVLIKLPQYDTHIYKTTGSEDINKIKLEYDRLQPDIVLVGGGDGTVKLTAKALQEMNTILCIVPLGSANGLANCMGIHTVEDAWEAVRNFQVHAIDAIHINGELCLHLADFGFNANLVKKFESTDGRGMLSYITSSVSEIFSTEPKVYRLTINGESQEVSAKMLVVANGDQYGTGALINCQGKLDDGKFEIIALNPESAKDYIRMTMAMFKGDLEEQDSSRVFRCESCVIENLEGEEFQIDGEIMGKPESVEAVIEKEAFQFITSKKYAACQKKLS